jgi:methionyl-tRNA formyltransferase
MMGTGPFAVPTFRALLEQPDRCRVLALFTRPERTVHSHGKQRPAESPMRVLADERGVNVLAPESINSSKAHEELRRLAADLFVVCDYGQILSSETLSLARLGGINLHASLLPKYRGAAPINWAIYHGETETGVTVIHMTPKLDAGPCLVQRSTPIGSSETAEQLEPRLAEMGAPAVLEAMDMLAGGREASGIVQDPKLATRAPRLKKADGLIDWSRTADEIGNQVRAFVPWPKSYTFWVRRDGNAVRLILDEVITASEELIVLTRDAGARPPPGTAILADKDSLAIVCGKGAIIPLVVQPAGKRAMAIDEFLRGHAVEEGDRFGETAE